MSTSQGYQVLVRCAGCSGKFRAWYKSKEEYLEALEESKKSPAASHYIHQTCDECLSGYAHRGN